MEVTVLLGTWVMYGASHELGSSVFIELRISPPAFAKLRIRPPTITKLRISPPVSSLPIVLLPHSLRPLPPIVSASYPSVLKLLVLGLEPKSGTGEVQKSDLQVVNQD